MHVIAGKAVSFHEALQPAFEEYTRQIVRNAKRLSDELMNRGCKLITNGTDNHLMLVDVQKSFGIDGAEAETILDNIGLTLNKNSIPDDTNPPFRPSGIRLGTPAITTRGASEDDMALLAGWLVDGLTNRGNQTELDSIKAQVTEFALSLKSPNEL